MESKEAECHERHATRLLRLADRCGDPMVRDRLTELAGRHLEQLARVLMQAQWPGLDAPTAERAIRAAAPQPHEGRNRPADAGR